MRKTQLLYTKLLAFIVSSIFFHSAHALPTNSLEDWVFNVDGTIYEDFSGDPLPATGVLVDGLGTLSLDITSAGSKSVIGYFDFEIFEDFNTFYNESGLATGTALVGQSWEIDEPGYIFGDIVDNVYVGALDNSNGVPVGGEDDVAFAIGWDFDLLSGDIATIDYIFTDVLPTVDFFLTQTDPDLGQSLYFYSELNIQASGPNPGPVSVPESPIISLVVIGLLGMSFSRKLRHGFKVPDRGSVNPPPSGGEDMVLC